MNAAEYLQSKSVFMQPDKRRYKIIKRNGHEVYVLKSKRISRRLMHLRFKKAAATGTAVRQAWINLSRAMSGISGK